MMKESRLHKPRTVQELYTLDGRVAVVTGGAGSGYGAQVGLALAEAGACVVITSRQLDKARQVARDRKTCGLSFEERELDLLSDASVRDLVEDVIKTYGRVDILVNNASANRLEPLETISVEQWNAVMAVNVTGTMLMCRAVAPHMLRQDKGVIVNIASIYGVVSPDQRIYGDSSLNSPLVYGASKAAVIQMTRYLATYWAPRIRVNCITPGGLNMGQPEDFVRRYEERTPLGRMAGQEDLKGTVVYLASDASAWVTGANLVVDGGWTAW